MHETKIEMKIHEEIKSLEEVCKKMTEEFAACIDNTESKDIPIAGQIVDMIKDLCEAKEKIVKACYYKYILGTMEKSEEEDKEEEKYMLRKMKEENADEYKRMREEYGEDEGERRFYDNYRYANGRFAPKGSGSYRPRSSGRRGGRRGYEEPMYFLPPEIYMNYSPEELRDMDRDMGRMYYGGGSGGSSSENSGGQSGGSGMSGGNMGNSGGGTRGYSDGYDDGQRRGYEDGYRDGESRGRSQGGIRDGREGRSGQSRRSYMETKEMNKENTPESKQAKMRSLEAYMKELSEDITEMIEGASNEEKTMLRSKVQTLAQKIQ